MSFASKLILLNIVKEDFFLMIDVGFIRVIHCSLKTVIYIYCNCCKSHSYHLSWFFFFLLKSCFAQSKFSNFIKCIAWCTCLDSGYHFLFPNTFLFKMCWISQRLSGDFETSVPSSLLKPTKSIEAKIKLWGKFNHSFSSILDWWNMSALIHPPPLFNT